MRQGRSLSPCYPSLPSYPDPAGLDYARPKCTFCATGMRNRIRCWPPRSCGRLRRSNSVFQSEAQSFSRTALLQYRFHNHEEYEIFSLGRRHIPRRLPIFQLFQSPQFRFSCRRAWPSNRAHLLPTTAANEYPGHWASLGPHRRGSQDDSAESRAEVLRASSCDASVGVPSLDKRRWGSVCKNGSPSGLLAGASPYCSGLASRILCETSDIGPL
jgi:hypothetical protein